MSIVFVGKKLIRSLNKEFRQNDRPTDVLAFGMQEGKGSHFQPGLLGEIVICPEVARSFARLYHNTTEEEIRLDVIHGILHLLGYDDSTPRTRAKMEKEQQALLRKAMKAR